MRSALERTSASPARDRPFSLRAASPGDGEAMAAYSDLKRATTPINSDHRRSPEIRIARKSGPARDLDREMRQRFETREPGAIIVRLASLAGDDRNDRPEMSRPQAPEMEIGARVAAGLDFLTQLAGHALVGIHIEQNSAGVADQAVGPAGDDASPDDAGQRVHPEPAKGASEQQADDEKNRYGSGGQDMDNGSTHVVVAGARSVRLFVLFENDGVTLFADP